MIFANEKLGTRQFSYVNNCLGPKLMSENEYTLNPEEQKNCKYLST